MTAIPTETPTETLTATHTETPSQTPSATLMQATASETPTASLTPSATATASSAAIAPLAASPTPVFTHTPTLLPPGSGQPPLPVPPPAAPALTSPPVSVNAARVAQLMAEITSANTRCPTPTIINLTASTYTLTAINDASFYGNNGLPIIRCDITLTGGSTNRYIQRSTATTTPLFRIFGVDSSGILRLNRVIVRYGRASQTGGSGILIIQGQAYLTNSQVVSNTLNLTTTAQIIGAGIYNYLGTLRVENSTVSSNTNTSTTADGGGIGIIGGTTAILNSTINSNRANRAGGGIAILQSAAAVTIERTRLQSNVAGTEGGAILSRGTNVMITRTLLQSNTLTSGTFGAAIFGFSNGNHPVVTNSCFISNGDTAAYGSTLLAQHNWWGHVAGPVVNGSSVNPRDSVNSPGVNYQPFVTTAPSNPPVNCINGIVPPTPTPTPTAPFCPAGLSGGDGAALQSCPTSTPTPTPTQTAGLTTWHVACNVDGGVANARNFPSAIFVGATPTPQIDGQVLMTIPAGTLLTVYQLRKDSHGVNWARITDFGAYYGETLWVREKDPTGTRAIIEQGNPTNCSAQTLNLAATPRPTVAGTYPTVPPGCDPNANPPRLCPLVTSTGWTDVEAVAWILACEAGNGNTPQERADALGIAHVIRNRMRSLLYEGTAREVISQQGQFDCWSDGASSDSGLTTVTSVADSDITEFARRLVLPGQPPLPDPFNNGIRWYGLYTYGLFSNASNRDIIRLTPPAVVGLLTPICTPPGGVANIYIDLAPFGSRFNATAFCSSFPDC